MTTNEDLVTLQLENTSYETLHKLCRLSCDTGKSVPQIIEQLIIDEAKRRGLEVAA